MNKKAYTGIDYFRIAAAFLIIAIHTSPLASFTETGDFILTRIIARIAVPFFFMTSGYFLISGYRENDRKLISFVKKTAKIYGIAIIIYLPLNFYNGYFSMENLLPNLIKDIIFDGTMYHLWYLPASILGAVIAWYLVKNFGMNRSFFAALVLYVIGIFGDSYYGVAEKIPFVKQIYAAIFEVSDYTRNGIFFAPVFFILGGMIAEGIYRIPVKKCRIGFLVSFLLLFAEAMTLHHYELQRHDSMYLMLLPCMFFLFSILKVFRGQRNAALSPLALVIYIIHPMMIVVVRMAAKLLHMQEILVENSLIHYIFVSALSFAAALCFVYLFYPIFPAGKDAVRQGKTRMGKDRAWIEINQDNLKHNIQTLQSAMPKNCELMAVVKAEAYGHGAFEVSSLANKMGVRAFAVATIEEGIRLRCYGITGEILILGYTSPARAKELHKYHLTQSLIDYDYAVALSRQGYEIQSHIKINTGMNRLGFDAEDVTAIRKIYRKKQLGICGIYTHLCVADSHLPEDEEFTHTQIKRFYHLIDCLEEFGIQPPKIHIQSSYGLLNYPELKCDYVRTGIAMYGVLSSAKDQTKLHLDLRPVLSLKARVVLLRNVKKGETVGYGRTFRAEHDCRIAIIAVGYADGVPRSLSCGRGEVLLGEKRVPVVGRICMDQLAVDVTALPEVAAGDIATIIGRDGELELGAAEVSDNSGSISNELLSRMGMRLHA